MFSTILVYVSIFLIFVSTTNTQQLEWILLSDGTSTDTPQARRDAALGFDQTFLLLYGGRTQTGIPLQDSYSFNILSGQWDTLNFPSPPPSRYGMAAASSMNGGLYIFGGFGVQGSSPNHNPYLSYASGQQVINYNFETPPNFIQNPILMNNPDFIHNPNYNPMSGTDYNNGDRYNDDDDRADSNYYPFQDAWFLSYSTKVWQETQASQYARGFGSAAAAPFTGDMPNVLYTMGKSRDQMYSYIESIGRGSSGLSQTGTTQTAMIMNDLPSISPAYPHARYGHSTTLLTDNYLLLYGGCLSGYAKGGPCPSKDTWLLQIDRGHWERLSECPPTKTGAAMVTIPSYSACGGMGLGAADMSANMNLGAEQAVAILWGGREFNPSSIRTYPSPRDEVAVFSLSQKQWSLKRAAPSPTDGSYPMQREGAAFVAGCFQGAPGMFVFGGRATVDRRLLSDLWFLQASPQGALSAPSTRGCIYPFSYYHLHGVFQFFTYGVIFPIGYLVGRHAMNSPMKRPLHMILQIFGVALAICGFSFGVHSVRTPSWLHFRHAHAIIGIITFILTIIQFLVGLIGVCLIARSSKKHAILRESSYKISQEEINQDTWVGKRSWSIIHRILGAIVLSLGFVNISLGVFLAVLPLPVWIVWFVYMSLLVIILVIMEIYKLLKDSGTHKTGSFKSKVERDDPRGTSQASLKYSEEPTERQPLTIIPTPRRSFSQVPPPNSSTRDSFVYRPMDGSGSHVTTLADMSPLGSSQIQQRQSRFGDVNASASLLERNRQDDKQYTVPPRKKSRSAERDDVGYYAGQTQDYEQSLAYVEYFAYLSTFSELVFASSTRLASIFRS
ncbi:unnamed protein product [Rotaria magnacalcarata]|uniref:Cytochrome b561 domain-containing protein n=2 Tax=Rotaria magnacalcarata TaxID=392030 RepID=A0A819ICT4_9BILA|nr:unnamed protein product [Rotaria magnacalcarata]